jgi:ribonucleotide reductase beta subunit family protein with ferritin-like domain
MPSSFQLPQLEELIDMGSQERLNVFRRFFASSRYGRLLIQQLLVRSATEKALMGKVVEMEKVHNMAYESMLETVRRYGFIEEFLTAVREEDSALQKIIEAYDKRMEGRM